MNPRIEVMLDGGYVLGLIDGEELLEAAELVSGWNIVCTSCTTLPVDIERAELYAECIKAVVEKCNELQETQA